MSNIKGKALLIITKTSSKYVPFEIVAHIQSNSCHNYYDLEEDFSLIETDTFPAPDVAYKLRIGERLWVRVTYKISILTDYWGESGIRLSYLKQRTLKRKMIKDKHYYGKNK